MPELARVHAKELIIQASRQQSPQARINNRRHPGLRLTEQLRVDPDLMQHFVHGLARRAALQQRLTHQMNRDGVFVEH